MHTTLNQNEATSDDVSSSRFLTHHHPPTRLAVFWRREKAPRDLLFTQLAQKPDAEGALTIGVEREDASAHPWAGSGSSKKYTLDGIQGVNLWLEAGRQYWYEATRVPGEHPFHFTRSPLGGKDQPDRDRLSRYISKDNAFPPLSYTPSGASALSRHFFQCTKHPLMGGKVTVYLPRTSLMFVDVGPDGTESAVLRSMDTNDIIVADDAEATTYETLSEALDAMGISISTKAAWKIKAPAHMATAVSASASAELEDYLFVAPLVQASSSGGNGTKNLDDTSPVVIMHGGTLAREQVYTMGSLREWMQSPHRHDDDVFPAHS